MEIKCIEKLWYDESTNSGFYNETSFRKVEYSVTKTDEGILYTDGQQYFVVQTFIVDDTAEAVPNCAGWYMNESDKRISQRLYEVDGSMDKESLHECIRAYRIEPCVKHNRQDTGALFEAYYRKRDGVEKSLIEIV